MASHFPGLVLQNEPDGEATLTGRIVDQAELRGVLLCIFDLGLVLIAVTPLPPDYL